MANICPVCGYPDLYEPAYDDELSSLEICPCCGFQFGYTDDALHIIFDQWRAKWIAGGMVWDKARTTPPV